MKKYSSILTSMSIALTLVLSLPSCTPKIGCYYFSQASNPKVPGLTCDENQKMAVNQERITICNAFSVENKPTTIENHKAVSN